jgi:hypothetical protein
MIDVPRELARIKRGDFDAVLATAGVSFLHDAYANGSLTLPAASASEKMSSWLMSGEEEKQCASISEGYMQNP